MEQWLGCVLIVEILNDYTGMQIIRGKFPSNGGTDWPMTFAGALLDGTILWFILSYLLHVI